MDFKKIFKKLFATLLAVIVTFSLAACVGGGEDGGSEEKKSSSSGDTTEVAGDTIEEAGDTIEVAVDFADIRLENFKTIIADFEKETGIKVELTAPGADYETIMKTRMASNDLPDVWATHGWSVMRYSDYLEPLNDQTWYASITDDAKGIISDQEGNIYVLPLSVGVSAIMYNIEVLENAGVVPEEIRTTADFEEACEKIKESGVTPIFIGGKDQSNGAGFLNTYLFPMMLTNDGAAYSSADSLQDGTFDWKEYGTATMQKMADYINAGFINENYTTADTTAMQTALGEGKCAFIIRGTLHLAAAKSYVPDANLGILPIPHYEKEGKNMFQVGESSCLGVWKDTENKEAALKLLDYIATKNVIPLMCEAEGSVPGLEGIELTDSYATDAFYKGIEQFEGNLSYDNVFDRKYFPSGMWSIMGEAATEIAINPTESGVKNAAEMLEENFVEKRNMEEIAAN